jgi:hypothetical protein
MVREEEVLPPQVRLIPQVVLELVILEEMVLLIQLQELL